MIINGYIKQEAKKTVRQVRFPGVEINCSAPISQEEHDRILVAVAQRLAERPIVVKQDDGSLTTVIIHYGY